MATVEKEAKAPSVSKLEKPIEYMPLGSSSKVELTINLVRQYLCTPTRSGKLPSDADVVRYMMLCKARALDPWVGDAYLVGYDSNDGPTFSLITAAQALHKRAEVSPEYDGMQSGVIVAREGMLEHREGTITLNGEELVGGWARVHRKDRQVEFYADSKRSTYDTRRSRWRVDPAGMIVKVAECAALRKAFPNQLGGLYAEEEMAGERAGERESIKVAPTVSEFDKRLEGSTPERAVVPEVAKVAAEQAEPQPDPLRDTEQGVVGSSAEIEPEPQEPPQEPQGSPEPSAESGGLFDAAPDPDAARNEFRELVAICTTIGAVNELEQEWLGAAEPNLGDWLSMIAEERRDEIRAARK